MFTEEQRLLLKAKERDDAAFSEIFDRYNTRIYWYLYKLVRSSEVAEDLLQDTFLRLYDNLRSYTPTGKVSAFIYKMAHNVAVNWHERQNLVNKAFYKERSKDSEGKSIEALDYIKDERFRPDMVAQGNERAAKTIAAINTLSDKCRVALLLVCVEGFSHEDAADILDCSVRALRKRLYRAKKLLADKIWRRR